MSLAQVNQVISGPRSPLKLVLSYCFIIYANKTATNSKIEYLRTDQGSFCGINLFYRHQSVKRTFKTQITKLLQIKLGRLSSAPKQALIR